MASSTTTTTGVICFDNTVAVKTAKNIFLNENYADFHFLFNEGGVQQQIPAHKAILAAASDVFATMLNGQWKEDNQTEIDDASFDVFKEFLQFLYLPQVQVSAENISEVINLGNKYNVRECMELCGQQIKQQLALDDVCDALDLALQFDLDELKNHCLMQISEETSKILATKSFLRCSKDSLKSILALDDTECDEIEMLNASLNWAKHACESKETDSTIIANIREELGDCLYAIRFGVMTTEEISNCVAKYDGLFNQVELRDFILTIGCHKSEAKIFKNIAERKRKWSDDMILECCLEINQNYVRVLKCSESTTFQINKQLLFGGVIVTSSYDEDWGMILNQIEIELFVFEMAHNTQKLILNQTFQNISSNTLKFEKAIRAKANTEYEVRMESKLADAFYQYASTTIGPNQQMNFGGGIVIQTKDKCTNFIKTLLFN